MAHQNTGGQNLQASSYDGQTAMAKAGDEIPDRLLEREQKMFDLGRKARMMSHGSSKD